MSDDVGDRADRFPEEQVTAIAPREVVKLADELEEREVPAGAVVMGWL